MTFFNYFKYSLIFLIATGCVVDIEETNNFSDRIVINAFLKCDEPIYIEFTKNYVQYPDFKNVTSGSLFVFESNKLIAESSNLNNRFLFNYTVRKNENYRLLFIPKTGDSVHAKTFSGRKFKTQNLGLKRFVGPTNDPGPLINIDVIDPPTKDFYELTCRLSFRERNNGQQRTSTLQSVVLPQNLTTEDSLNNEVSFLFSDSSFHDSIISLDIKTSLFLKENYEWFADTFKYIFTIRNVSYSYYQYQRTKFLHRYNQEGDFFTGNSSASPVYSNIKGGLGIFGGYYEVKDSIIVVKP